MQKNGMIKLIIITIIIAFISPIANATSGQLDFGGKLDDGDLSIVTSVDYNWAVDQRRERDIEFDYRYKDRNGKISTNRGLIELKERFKFESNHYIFNMYRYDYNEFRAINHRHQANIGWGYKILKTDKVKLSNELAIGYLNTDLGDEVIFRNSLWFFYEVAPKINFTNKFLYEDANTPLIRNETQLDYLLTDTVKIGLKNIYVEDPISDNILSFNLGYVW